MLLAELDGLVDADLRQQPGAERNRSRNHDGEHDVDLTDVAPSGDDNERRRVTELVGAELEKRDEIGLEMVKLEEGDWPEVGEDTVVLGYHAKNKHNLAVGDSVSIKDEDLSVIGHLEEIGGAIDYSLLMSWKTLDNVLGEEEYAEVGR